ncbi:ferrochelatase [Gordonia jinhuaensis]|uniref:Coproporphyrin III ferrochelatase n=1 Tax=Gordonia jinhuaensis TaxID=1517702 RepID=A0A916T0K9_9ACTN|nr:ferrochelatase [Gordonia jinhuaensis]GGB24577.1 ferrochelatase [Gordonia jinhuaensis]
MTLPGGSTPTDRIEDAGQAAFDAVLFLSFGGPENRSEVMPFLENVTRGRGIPRERLDAVAEHYYHFDGVSPINGLNRQMIDALSARLDEVGPRLPIYFGNRNWHPFAEDTVEQMYSDGHRRILVFPTSAWGGYSGCRQYHEDIARAVDALADGHPGLRPQAVVLRKLPQYWDRPEFFAASAAAILAAREELPAEVRGDARLVFTAHSIPISADTTAGPPADGGHLYSRQVARASAAAAAQAGYESYDQVWQSRSGPPSVPWLEPDICDHLDALAAQGVTAVIAAPIGFISDHLEVVWDLDNEAAERAEELGIAYVRAATVGTDPRFIAMIADLIGEYASGAGDLSSLGCGDNGQLCRLGCCAVPARPARPAR